MKVSFPGSGLTGLSQIDWTNPGFLNRINQVQNQTTWLRGTHSFKFGAEVRHIDWEEQTAPANLFGNVDFTGRFTAVPGIAASGHPYADFLFGVPNTASRAFPPVPALRSRSTYDFFAQDDWKLTRNLTLNLGLRYELHPGWTEREDRLAFFDIVSGKIVVPDGGVDNVSPLMPTSYVDVVAAGSLGLPSRTLVRTDRNNFAPRLGFAYRPFGGGETVIRGGYGLYYDMMPIDIWASRAPFVFQETAFTNPAVPTVVLPTVFPATGTTGPATIALPLAVNPDLQLPYSHQWNATIEHERWRTGFRLSYVATLGREMWYTRDVNAPVADGRLYIEKSRPFPRYPDIVYADNGATHDYHGVTLEAERRFAKGLFFQAAYTAAKDRTETVEWFNAIENPFDLGRERSRDSATPLHRVTTAVMYDLPFGHDRTWLSSAPRLVDLALGGWQVSMVGYLQSRHLSDADYLGSRSDRHQVHHRGNAAGHLNPSRSAGRSKLERSHDRPLVRRGRVRCAASGTLRHGRARRDRGAWPEPVALRTAQAIQVDRSSGRPDVPHRDLRAPISSTSRSGRTPM